MSREKLPEPSGWRKKLDDPQELSAWVLSDKEVAWEKLHARLGKRPRRIGAAWYWAAACILAIAGLALLFREGHGGKPRNTVAVRPASTVRPGPHAGDPGHLSGGSMTELEQVIRAGTPREGFKTPARKKGRVHLPMTATIASDAHNGANDRTFGSTHPIERLPDSPQWIAKRDPLPAKPMRVVHINELDGTARSTGISPSLAGGSSPSHWLRWGRGHAPDTGLYSAQEDLVRPVHPIITIHLSPQN